MNEQINDNLTTSNNGVNNSNVSLISEVPNNNLNVNQLDNGQLNNNQQSIVNNNFTNNTQFIENNFGLGNQNIPQIMPEINSVPNNNIGSSIPTQVNDSSAMPINADSVQSNEQPQLYDTTNTINDKVVVKTKNKKTLNIDQGLKTAIVLALILLVAIFIIPKIFDLFL